VSYAGRLFDLQVNGFRGVDFSSPELTEETCAKAVEEYLRDGASMFLPTVITASQEVYRKNLGILSTVCGRREFRDRVPGLHLEGPFISDRPGAVGAHNPAWVRRPDIEYFKCLQDAAGGMVRLITIAAEAEGAAALCEAVSAMGVCVSLGHQLAGYDDLSRLADAGARAITHLGNAMPNQVDRHNNPLVNGLIHPDLVPMIITDGHHLPPHLVDGIVRLRGEESVVFVSDASPIAGLPPGEYSTLGNPCVLEENGLLHNPEKQCLVGSSFTMQACADFLSNSLSYRDDRIERMGLQNAADLVGVPIGH